MRSKVRRMLEGRVEIEDSEFNAGEERLITSAEVQSRMNQLPDKAPGHLGMHNRMIRGFTGDTVDVLTSIFNDGWVCGCFPDCWKLGVVAPTPKVSNAESL